MSQQLDTLTADMTALKAAFGKLVTAFDANTDALRALQAQGSVTPDDLSGVIQTAEDLKAQVLADLQRNTTAPAASPPSADSAAPTA